MCVDLKCNIPEITVTFPNVTIKKKSYCCRVGLPKKLPNIEFLNQWRTQLLAHRRSSAVARRTILPGPLHLRNKRCQPQTRLAAVVFAPVWTTGSLGGRRAIWGGKLLQEREGETVETKNWTVGIPVPCHWSLSIPILWHPTLWWYEMLRHVNMWKNAGIN